MRIFPSVSVHLLFFFFGAVLDNSSLVELAGESVDNKLNMHHPPWWENTSTMITQRRIKVSLAKVENNAKHKTIMPSFLLPDGLFAVRTITSFIHDCNRYCETLRCWTTWQSHDQLTTGSEILRSHKRIYLSSLPRLPSVTMPFHMVIKMITSVNFLLSWAAFTKVSAAVYTHENFTQVNKLCYCSKKLKCKHSISTPLFSVTCWSLTLAPHALDIKDMTPWGVIRIRNLTVLWCL